jgi:hypothetical protein
MIPLPKYLSREAAAAFIAAQGIEKITVQALADLKYRGKGPKCGRVNGKAVYTAEWLLEWIEAEIARSAQRRARGADRQQQPAP